MKPTKQEDESIKVSKDIKRKVKRHILNSGRSIKSFYDQAVQEKIKREKDSSK